MQLALDSVREPAIEIRVAGIPQPKGSKAARISGKRIKVGNEVAVIAPTVQLVEQADQKTTTMPANRLKRWEAAVNRAAFVAWREAHGGRSPDPWDCPVELAAEFVFPRPESDWLASGKLRKGANDLPQGKPDLSKLVRAVEDAIKGIVYRDDSRVCRYGEVIKRYAARGKSGGVILRVRPI